MAHNLRHLRLFKAAIEAASLSRGAERFNLSQSAVSQAIAKLERDAGADLVQRAPQGIFATAIGAALLNRVTRALDLLDRVMSRCSGRLKLTATTSQLRALIVLREAENFTLAARQIGIAQPTVHRAITKLEQEAGQALFERTAYGLIPTRIGKVLADGACLAFAELAQADMELAEASGRDAGRIVIGALPLSRSCILPQALAAFRERRPKLPILVLDGTYDDLLGGLRRGEIDFMVGALREPAPIPDIEQTALFEDHLVLAAGPDHPLVGSTALALAELASYPWVVAREGTPTRHHFERLFAPLGEAAPRRIIESGSLILMRQLLQASDHLGCISALQVAAEIEHGLLATLPFNMESTKRLIGITSRSGWMPTPSQAALLEHFPIIRNQPAPPANHPQDPTISGGWQRERAGADFVRSENTLL